MTRSRPDRGDQRDTDDQRSQYVWPGYASIPFISDSDLKAELGKANVPPAQAEAVQAANSDARLAALRTSPWVVALFAVAAPVLHRAHPGQAHWTAQHAEPGHPVGNRAQLAALFLETFSRPVAAVHRSAWPSTSTSPTWPCGRAHHAVQPKGGIAVYREGLGRLLRLIAMADNPNSLFMDFAWTRK